MSAGIRVRVRTPGGEVEIEVGDPASVDAAMDVASRIMRELASKPQGGPPARSRGRRSPSRGRSASRYRTSRWRRATPSRT